MTKKAKNQWELAKREKVNVKLASKEELKELEEELPCCDSAPECENPTDWCCKECTSKGERAQKILKEVEEKWNKLAGTDEYESNSSLLSTLSNHWKVILAVVVTLLVIYLLN